MRYSEPFLFGQLKPDAKTHFGLTNIALYFEGVTTQYARIYEIWTLHLPSTKSRSDVARQKRRLMKQVVRDIHSLLIFLRSYLRLSKLFNKAHYPNFSSNCSVLNDKWKPYFDRYRDLRNTFEHYDDSRCSGLRHKIE